jgi:two-component system, cell cycle response regulator
MNSIDKKKIHLLIAEDDRVSGKLLEKHTKDWGFEVSKAHDGAVAWKIYQESKDIQIAILDWMMPKLSGIELCQKIRAENQEPYVYLILLTSKNCPEDIISGLNAGADDYITKPFNPSELRARLKTGERIIKLEHELRMARQKFQELAMHDGLTNLLNRVAILDELTGEIARSYRTDSSLSSLMLDIDHFKNINDTYGHQVGDEVLVEVAARLKDELRVYDKIGRYGGDEFFIVLSSCTWEFGKNVAGRLLRRISGTPVETQAGPVKIAVSIGLTSTDKLKKVTSEIMVSISDKALYQAKNKGRNCYVAL